MNSTENTNIDSIVVLHASKYHILRENEATSNE